MTVSAANPTLITTPSPDTVTLGTTSVRLKDTADLENGYFPTGDITFELFRGSTLVHTEMVTVNGNGIYTTPTGFTLPTSGTVTGTYQWDATYSGDASNSLVSDNNADDEQVTVSAASPAIVTTANPTGTIMLGTTSLTLNDTAVLAGGYNPTGTLLFTLKQGGATVFTQTDTVTGNGTYTTAGFTLPTTGTVTGTYTWTVAYSGDGNNNAANDQGGAAEQVTVSAASPTLTTAPTPATVTLGATTPPLLTDTATLSGGFDPTGDITFELFRGSTLVHTEMVAVSGDGAYTTPTGFTLPTTGTATGTYQWDATYSGDVNNSSVSDNNAADEQVTVSAASPMIVTIANPTGTITLGTTSPTLNDTADLESGYNPTGTLLFTLKQGGATVFTQTDAVTGNGTYTTPGLTLPTTGTVTGTYTWTVAYSGDGNNNAANDQGGAAEQTVVSAASPTLTTAPNLTTVTLGATAPPLLTDTADLEGGYFPTGDITFELFRGSTLVHTEMVAVSGNGAYTTPTGFTLPTSGTVAGTYEWVAIYTGDDNNSEVSDSNPAAEQVTVIPASPTLVTTASPTTVTLPAPVPTFLTDTADLTGGFNPGGNVVFTLTGPGGFSYTQTDAVSGNGTYTASTTLPTTGTVAGTYTWTANYEGDNNNAAAADQGGVAEQTVVGSASLTLVTIASPNVTLPTGPPGTVTLSDSAFLSGGQSPTGSIVFTLTGPGAFSYTQTDTVSGNGTYSAQTTLPTTVTVAGTYTWTAHYGGDPNNNAANDQGGVAEQTVVSPASPTLVTTASSLAITLGTTSPTLNDTADLENGYNPTGMLLFTLKQGGATVFTQTDAVTGNGMYTTAGFTLPPTGTATGTYTWTVAYGGDGNNAAATDQGGAAEQTVVSPASLTLVTTAGSAITLVGATAPTLTDSAVLSGGYFPTGAITFTLTGPGGFAFTEDVTVNGNGAYTASTTLPTTVAGVYTWTAHFGGDGNNNAANDQGGAAEQVMVAAASPTLTTTPDPITVTLGATAPPTLTDSATLADGANPTGTITFTLVYNTTTVDTETVQVNGNGAYATPTGFTLPSSGTATGTYQWDAIYSGDGNNNAASDDNAVAEQVTVSAASPTITTTPNPTTDLVGGTLQDVADLAGGFDPTGSITFSLYAPGVDPTVGPAAHTETITVSGNGTYATTVGFVANASGTWHWVAIYTGDSNNNLASSGPLDEPVVIPAQSVLTLTKTVDDAQPLFGEQVTYTFTLHNTGPGTAMNVSVSDPFPPGLAFISANPSQGTFDPVTDVWTVGSLAAGTTATMQATAVVQVLGPLVNTATASAVNIDPSLSNLTSSAGLTVFRTANLVSKAFFLADPVGDPPAASESAPSTTSSKPTAAEAAALPSAGAGLDLPAGAATTTPPVPTSPTAAVPAVAPPGNNGALLSGGGGGSPDGDATTNGNDQEPPTSSATEAAPPVEPILQNGTAAPAAADERLRVLDWLFANLGAERQPFSLLRLAAPSSCLATVLPEQAAGAWAVQPEGAPAKTANESAVVGLFATALAAAGLSGAAAGVPAKKRSPRLRGAGRR